jgi:hypothetical protein
MLAASLSFGNVQSAQDNLDEVQKRVAYLLIVKAYNEKCHSLSHSSTTRLYNNSIGIIDKICRNKYECNRFMADWISVTQGHPMARSVDCRRMPKSIRSLFSDLDSSNQR